MGRISVVIERLRIRVNLIRIGALTSKSYAFIARPWELEKVNIVDYFDSFGSSATAELRGFDLVRILPRINNKVNEEWLTDRARFFFDGLRYQRLLQPLIKKNLRFVPVSWEFVKNFFLNLFRVISMKQFKNDLFPAFFFNFLIGEADDLLRSVALKVVAQRSGNATFHSFSQVGFFGSYIDSINHFFLPSIEELEEAGLIIIAGFDLRFELPLLLVKIRGLIEKNNLKVIFFGTNPANLNLRHYYGGSSFNDLLNFFVGKHRLSRKLIFEFKRSFCFLSFEFAQRIDMALVNSLVVNKLQLVVVFPYLGLTKLNQAIAGLFSTFKTWSWNSENDCSEGLLSLTLISSNNEFKLTSLSLANSFLVYLGSHGDSFSAACDMILPSSLIYERINCYVNMFYQYQVSSFVYAPKRLVRDSLAFFFFLNKVFFFEFISIYDSSKEFLAQFLFTHLGLSGIHDFFNKNMFALEYSNSFFNNCFVSSSFSYFSHFLSNSYVLDSFSKNSRVLSLAALERTLEYSNNYKY